MKKASLLALALAGSACGSSASSTTTTGAPQAGSKPVSSAAVAAAPKSSWVNPGGMWLPTQMMQMADTLKALGLAILPSSLGDPERAPLGAIVALGGCSASFVSPDGLIATNHHCVQVALARNSTPAENLIEKGFVARAQSDEKWAGPTAHAYVATKITDVTSEMTVGLDALPSDLARQTALETREKKLLAGCERDRPDLRCKVDKSFGGGLFQLVEQLDIRDLRLVYAPPHSVGNYGGEVDNWMWPRHGGDFSLYRAYVGADGRPADHAAGNQPYHPQHFLKVARDPLLEGDLVIVAGYPGTTSRLATAEETDDAATFSLPRVVALNEQYLAVLDTVTKDKPELRIKAEPKRRGLANYLKKNGGVVKTLVEGGVLQKKKDADAKLFAWIDADDARKAKYGPAIEKIRALDADRRKSRDDYAAFTDLMKGSVLLEQALTIARLAEERAKPDSDRKLEYQKRNWDRLLHTSEALSRSYARELDRAAFKMFIQRAQGQAAVAKIAGKKFDDKGLDAALDKLYAGTKLEDAERRKALLETATVPALRASNDPFIKLALALLPDVKAHEAAFAAYEGGMAVAKPLYVEARREFGGGAPIAPDANSSLRITFGHVIAPVAGGRPFTTVSELAAKATGKSPFDAPQPLLDAIAKKAGAGYVAKDLGEVPVDFMSDVDITNGNSGSATMNARGELVGLAFDGTLDTVASDWQYLEGLSRTIHVDVRYLLFYLDVVDGADRILAELGVRR